MATAHLIYGHAGTGKTTLARRLETELSAIRFSHDEWMVRLHGNDPPAAEFADKARRVSDVIDTLRPRVIMQGISVVLDLGFWTRRHRDATRDMAKRAGATAKLYCVSCTEEEAWSRIEKRNAALEDSLLITRPTFDLLRLRVEPLGDDEDRIEM